MTAAASGARGTASAERPKAWWARIPGPVVDGLVVAVAVADVLFSLGDSSGVTQALAALACLALVARRRLPLAVFLLTLPASLMLDIVFAPIAALFTLAERSRDRRLLTVCALLLALAGAAPWPLDLLPAHERTWTAVYFFYTLATAVAPVLMGQLVQTRRDLRRRLVEIEEAREHERLLHSQAVLARERAQLAREMHDVVSHQVSLIAVQAGALQVAATDPDFREGARTIRALSVDTLDELRHMVALLRASGGRTTELTPQPTLADLRKLVTTSGIDVTLSGELPRDIGTPAQRALYRTVQEALTNVRKHAPGARAAVRLWHQPGAFGVTVTNTPPTRPSLPLPGSRQGLIGLAERAELLGGTFESGATGDGGYRVTLRIPADGDT
ncbi:sensor histidine kinase [Streptomyces griseorubiginosus]|uniref:sensor histidine kinase n=1 Tax=Streptomyces griseorubiginosus TaxID=67304 RepID=UPI002E80B83B|nr:histidine kinase [Streptomyces griseorubiginosus]WUB49644.1 histidine kinase [Streptomyces griseorubiginosus]WUB58173.1 histidine kinase [Streptomyces griseorubiginosus]